MGLLQGALYRDAGPGGPWQRQCGALGGAHGVEEVWLGVGEAKCALADGLV